MAKQRRTKPARHEITAMWIAAALFGIFAGVYLSSVLMAWLHPTNVTEIATLERLLTILVPLVTLAVQWYLGRRR